MIKILAVHQVGHGIISHEVDEDLGVHRLIMDRYGETKAGFWGPLTVPCALPIGRGVYMATMTKKSDIKFAELE